MRPKNPPYLHIPEGIYKIKNLTPNQKFVLSNICNVICAGGVYQFDNQWISTFTLVSKRQVSAMITVLINKGYITSHLIYKKESKEIEKRVLKLTSMGIEVGSNTPRKSTSIGGGEVDFLDNNKGSLVNTLDKSNNKDINQRCDVFINEVHSFKEYEQHHAKFIDYWSEPNKSKTKMKFELERTWDTKRRLRTWTENSDTNFGKNNPNREEEIKKIWRDAANG